MRTRTILMQTIATLVLVAAAADARVRIRTPLAPTPIAADASGRARLSVVSPSEGRFDVILHGLAPDASYEIIVGDVRVATVVTSGGGKGRVRFRTRPRGDDLPLGFDPRGATLVVRDSDGADVLVATIPLVGNDDENEGDLVCCIPDDSGPKCEDRTQAECDAQGGTVIVDATSCMPNPCTGAPPVDDEADLICCLPHDPDPECEDRTQAECLDAGGVVVSATSCDPDPCTPIAPPAGEVICCLPDNGGDGDPECEDLTADACVTAGGTVSSATSCTTDPCGAAGGGGGTPSVRVTCERRTDRSKISVDGRDLAAGSYQARALSGSQSATAPAAPAVGDQAEFDFDSDPGDIANGATAIAANFIEGDPPQVTGQILDGGGAVVVESTVTCTQQ